MSEDSDCLLSGEVTTTEALVYDLLEVFDVTAVTFAERGSTKSGPRLFLIFCGHLKNLKRHMSISMTVNKERREVYLKWP